MQKRPRKKPHKRTPIEADPRIIAWQTLRRLKYGDLIAPALTKTIQHFGSNDNIAQRARPMLEDATRFALLFDHLISHVATRKAENLDPDVRSALHLFLSWYLIGDSSSAYAHGNTCVEMLGEKHKAKGFVNACVRRLGELLSTETRPVETWDDVHAMPELPRNAFRLGNGRWGIAALPILPDPEKDLPSYLSIVGSIPIKAVRELHDQHGDQAVCRIALAGLETPRTWLRANTLKTSVEDLALFLENHKIPVSRYEGTLHVDSHSRGLTQNDAFREGRFYIQDFSAQQVAPMAVIEPEWKVLDLCSAPGGKAGHLSELSGGKADILACDLTQPKVDRIHDNVRRMGYDNIATVVADAADISFPEHFDAVLLDAPCSNSGVLARRVEARHRLDATNLTTLTEIQAKLLENAARNVKPHGVLVYSVCSVLMEEGIDQVYRFLRSRVDPKTGDGVDGSVPKDWPRREDLGWEIEAEKLVLPVPGLHDGGYVCRIRQKD